MQRDRRGSQCELLTTSQGQFIFDQEEKKKGHTIDYF